MFEWLIILVLCVAVIVLWDRLRFLETRLEKVERHDYAQLPELSKEPPDQIAPGTEVAPEPVPTFPRTAPREKAIAARIGEPIADESTIEGPAFESVEEKSFQLPTLDFEDIFGRRLPIWLGGIALAVGGIFLVRYSIERGLLGPQVRVALSFLFGLLLLGGAEAAYRFEERVADPRVRQALAGAGITTLYAAFYLAGAMYGLIGPAVAFAGLAVVTAAALALSFRFGLPTAVLGLVGGFATPMLVASEEANVPVLAFYLALLTAGLALTARRLGHRWLGAAALAGGFIWGLPMLISQPGDTGDLLAIGVYLLALGAAIPLVIGGHTRLPFTRLVSGGAATIQMVSLVAIAGFDLPTWGLYLLLAAALAILSWQSRELRIANAMALALGVVMLFAWPTPGLNGFTMVTTGLAVVGLGLPLALLWKDRADPLAIAQMTAGALGLGFASHFHFGFADNAIAVPGLAVAFVLLAAPVALGAWKLWAREDTLGKLVALPIAAAAILAFGATHVVLPDWAEVIGASVVALALIEIVRRKRDMPIGAVAWAGAVVTFAALFSTEPFLDEASYIYGGDQYGTRNLFQALIRWGVAALPFAVLAWIEWRRALARIAEIMLALIAYVWLAQIVPGPWLAWCAAIVAIGIIWWLRSRGALWGAFITIAFLWALPILFGWGMAGVQALRGLPMLESDLAEPARLLRHVLPVALATAFAWWSIEGSRRGRVLLATCAFVAVTVLVHTLFKQLFALGYYLDFVSLGMAERTVWQTLLISVGVASLRWLPDWRSLAMGLLAAGLAHFTVFTFLLHNPLWSEQAVGVLPIANWLAPAYIVAGAGVWWFVRQNAGPIADRLRALGEGVIMLLLSFWALSALRHGFAGSVLTSTPMSQAEDLLRSLTGIVLALGFLWWGSRTGKRSWRIGSLVLILLAVFKVFLVDAAGLDDLLRVASFIALGFSLIGIGWVYTRQLRPEEP